MQQLESVTPPETSDLIFDVGSHKGEDSDFYLKLGYRVVAIEAHPTLVQDLKKRFSDEINSGRYRLVDKAIGESEETITFYINKQVSVWGTANPKWAKRNEGLGTESEEIEVQSVRFSDVVTKYGCPYYLKIDVEGADMLCVDALQDLECRPKYISIESSKTSWSDLLNEFNALEKLGYTRFAVVDQKAHKSGEFRNRSGQLISYSFVEGASGPFGEQINAVWLTKKQAICRYLPIFFLYKTIGDNTFLPKILRRLPIIRRILEFETWYDTHAMRV